MSDLESSGNDKLRFDFARKFLTETADHVDEVLQCQQQNLDGLTATIEAINKLAESIGPVKSASKRLSEISPEYADLYEMIDYQERMFGMTYKSLLMFSDLAYTFHESMKGVSRQLRETVNLFQE